MSSEFGFSVGGEFYEWPHAFKWPESILIKEFTGLDWMDFLEKGRALFDENEASVDYPALAGIIAISVWRKHPEWDRRRVIQHMNGMEIEAFDLVVPDAGDDADPPAGKAGSIPQSTPAERSGSDSDSTSEPSTPPSSGAQTSPTSLEALSA